MAKIPQIDYTICTLKKHKGKTWEEIAHEEPSYIQWVLDTLEVSDALYLHLNNLLEEVGYD